MRWVAFGAVSLAVAGWSGSSQAVTRPVPAAKMPEVVRQGVLSAIAIVRDRGSTGLKIDLERCYRRIAAAHDQTAAVYCMTQDRVETSVMKDMFPNGRDPYFNFDSFAVRAAKATSAAVEPAAARTPFIQLLVAAQADAMETISKQVSDSSK